MRRPAVAGSSGRGRGGRPAARDARSSAGTTRRRSGPGARSARRGRARSAGCRAGSAPPRARAPRGLRRRRRPTARRGRARLLRSPRRRPGRRRRGRPPVPRSTGTRPGGAGTSSSPPARPGACAHPSARAAGRRAADRAGRRSDPTARSATLQFAAAMPAPPTAAHIREVNVRYHDAAAEEYDGKWGVVFGPTGQGQVLGKLRKALGRDGELPAFERGLEIGAGTGYFTLNLMLAGVLREAVCTDISPGMLTVLEANATELGLEVETVAGDAERLALPGGAFDPVFGPPGLHHLPDLQRALAAFHRVLCPGGAPALPG